MKFSVQIFLAVFLAGIGVSTVGASLFLRHLNTASEQHFHERYQTLATYVGDTFQEVDRTTDRIMENAVVALREIERRKGLPSNEDLLALRKRLGVDGLYITNDKGRFIRADWFLIVARSPELTRLTGGNPLSKSLFSFCERYKELLTGTRESDQTPLVPSAGLGIPSKYFMIPNHDRTRILEAEIDLPFFTNVLEKGLAHDPAILSVALYTPQGNRLGYVHFRGGEAPEKLQKTNMENIAISSPKDFVVILANISATKPDCCECRVKHLSGSSGEYFYTLRTEVSLRPLQEELKTVRNSFLFLLSVLIILSGGLAYVVSRGLVKKIEEIQTGMESIIQSTDLNHRLSVYGPREIKSLAVSFNTLMHRLSESQSKLVESEREKAVVELAKQVAHDIRSPLGAMKTIMSQPELIRDVNGLALLRGAVDRIHGIAEQLMRKKKSAIDDLMLLSTILEVKQHSFCKFVESPVVV